MEKDKLKNIIENVKDKPNKDLLEAEDFLFQQHESLKLHIIDLTKKLESIENLHDIVIKEIENRKLL
jgi:hypothetical protein